jgi:hypothetical protein
LHWGWGQFGAFLAARQDLGRDDPFGFSWLLAISLRKPPIMRVGFPWISLDSLVRVETYQWVTRHKRAKVFLGASAPGVGAPRREPPVKAMRKRTIVHEASLMRILLFRNKLSSGAVPFRAPTVACFRRAHRPRRASPSPLPVGGGCAPARATFRGPPKRSSASRPTRIRHRCIFLSGV